MCRGQEGQAIVPGTDEQRGSRRHVAIGLGGRVELWDREIRIIKGGVLGHLTELLWLGYGLKESSLLLDQIAAVEIVRSIVLPDFIRFSYAGSPDLTGNYVHDALAENALMMNLFDNRKFFDIKQAVEEHVAQRDLGRPAARRYRRGSHLSSRGGAR